MYESFRWYWTFGEPGGSIDDELLDRVPGSYVGMRKPMSWPSMPADGGPRRGSYRPSADDAAEGARRKTLDAPELKRLSFSLGFCQSCCTVLGAGPRPQSSVSLRHLVHF